MHYFSSVYRCVNKCYIFNNITLTEIKYSLHECFLREILQLSKTMMIVKAL